MTESKTPPATDLARIIEYLDGNLDGPAMLAFERRLEREPELARALEDFEGIDRLQRAHVRPRPVEAILGQLVEEDRAPPRSHGKLLAFRLSLAAAAVVVVGTAAWFFARRPQAALAFQVAALGIEDASPERVNRLLGLDETWLPARMRDQPGADEPAPPSDPEYLQAALAAQETRAREALAAATPSVSAGRFALVLRPEGAAWALVVAVPRAGPPVRLFPAERDSAPAERLPAGELAFLPRPFVAQQDVAGEAPRAGFDYGFLVPLGAGELRVLVGLSTEPPGRELLAEIDRQLAASSGPPAEAARSLSAWLAERGFSVGERLVVEGG